MHGPGGRYWSELVRVTDVKSNMNRSHPCYTKTHRHHDSNLREAAALLGKGPWFWPGDRDWEALEVAQRATNIEMKPDFGEGAVGRIPLVAYKEKKDGSLWLVDLSVTSSGSDYCEFLDEAKQVWMDAISAVPSSIPVLWKSLENVSEQKIFAQKVANFRGVSVLDGRSFGLAFGLALVSKLLEVPLPVTWMASADIDEKGRVGEVDALEEKIDTIWNYAPRVRRLLVAKEQEEKAERYSAGRIDIVGVNTLTEAVNEVFDDLPRRLVELGEEQGDREDLVKQIFDLCLTRRDAIRDWSPVGGAARLARKGWAGLRDADIEKLTIAEAVSLRHEDNSGEIQLPLGGWFDTLSKPKQVEVAAHIVQQSTDTGTPEEWAALKFAKSYLVSGNEAFEPHLKLMGAMGRLYFIVGQLEESLEMQKEALEQWIERRKSDEVSYPLSFAYTVVGAMGDGDEYEALKKSEHQWRSRSSVTPKGEEYVLVSRGRAAVFCGDWERARDLLDGLAQISSLSGPFQDMVDRWRLYVLEEMAHRGDFEESEAEVRRQIVERHDWTGKPRCAHTWWLEMARALRDENATRALQCARKFIEVEGKIAERMIDHADCAEDALPTFLLRRYPY